MIENTCLSISDRYAVCGRQASLRGRNDRSNLYGILGLLRSARNDEYLSPQLGKMSIIFFKKTYRDFFITVVKKIKQVSGSDIFFLLPFIFLSCNPAKRLPDDSYLLTKTIIHSDNKSISKEDLYSIVKQKPNRKILGLLRFHLRTYNLATRGKEYKWKSWLKSVGEEPVIADSALTKKSSRQLGIYLKNKGYFNGSVSDSTFFSENKTAQTHYYINSGTPYTVNKIIYCITDDELLKPIGIANKKSLIKFGKNYDTDVFAQERERMANAMKNLGYYNFSKEYVFYQMDSALNGNLVNVLQTIKNPYEKISVDGKDSLVETVHRVYFIRNIYINTNYNPQQKVSLETDTMLAGDYCFINASALRFRPEVILKSVFIETDDLYSLENVEYTHNRLAALKTFKFINIRFEEVKTDSGKKELDCYILLTPNPRQSMSFETEGTHRSGNLGVAGELVYRNKNIFKGAEVLEIKMRGGLEVQKLVADTSTETVLKTGEQLEKIFPFNTVEINPEATLFFPTLLIPFGMGKSLRPQSPKTNMSASYNFQQRVDYNRHIFNTSFGYSLKTSTFKNHALFPLDISVVKIDMTPDYKEKIQQINNPFLRNSFTDHLIAASRYNYTYSNQRGRNINFIFFRWNAEASGNALRLFNKNFPISDSVLVRSDTSGVFYFFNRTDKEGLIIPTSGIQYAQYLKTDVDFRTYNIVNERSNIVYRTFFGIGKPLKNFPVLPFEKSYFAGGANGIRAWSARSLGPGSSQNTTGLTIDKIGDIQLEGNIEYRFDLIKVLDGAVFADAGNVWLLKKDATRENAEFDFNRFYNEIAIGAGVGARLDFDFFIIRLDLGAKVKDPSLPLKNITGEKNGWVIQHFFDNEWKTEYQNFIMNRFNITDRRKAKYPFLILNLGIGYPF